MGDRLGTPGAVGFSIFLRLQFSFDNVVYDFTPQETVTAFLEVRSHTMFVTEINQTYKSLILRLVFFPSRLSVFDTLVWGRVLCIQRKSH